MRWHHRPAVHVAGLLAVLLAAHLLSARNTEPFFNNDETRHTMTGVFVADALGDLPASAADPKGYAVRYYCQYPALGIISWPPFFYLVEGLAMLAFGPHFLVGRVCVAAFAAVAVVYSYRFARLALPHPWALLAAGWVGLTPVVFLFTQRVMLEMPCFAMVMAAVVHFEKYLADRRTQHALLTGLFAAAAVLTRYDGLVLLPYFFVRLLATRNLPLLASRPVLVAVGLATLLAAPYYAFTWAVYGEGLSTAATTGTTPESTGFFHPSNFVFYPLTMPEQTGWGIAAAAVIGFALALLSFRHGSGQALGLLLAVYVMFTPLAQVDTRHAIYWLPAVAVCAARPVQWLWERNRKWPAVVAVLTVTGWGVWELACQQYRFVFGYEDAAKWVTDHRTTDRPIMVDGELTGSLVYHVRLHDPERKVWVLRGDKLLYAMFSDPGSGYRQHAHTEAEVLALLEKWDPEYVVVEDPPPSFHRVQGAELLAQTLRANSGDDKPYEVAWLVPVLSNYDRFYEPGAALVIYRKKHRNPAAATDIQIELVGLGRTVGATRP